MSKFLFKIRHYPWQISGTYSKNYTESDLFNKDEIELSYTGGLVLELPQELVLQQINFGQNPAFLPLFERFQIETSYCNLIYYNNLHKDAYLRINQKKIALKLTNTKEKSSQNLKAVEHYLSYFDELIKDDNNIYCEDLYPKLSELFGDGYEKPRYSFIASIAPDLIKILPQIFSGLRKILVGQRMMMPISRVKELDAPCIRHLIKQPGDTIQEKTASNDFKMLAIARVEKFDLLENRVLKDFIIRAEKACRVYLDEYKGKGDAFKHSLRLKQVRSLLCLLQNFRKEPVFKLISQQKSLPTPNYVLQNERRYKVIWKYYLSLVRKEKRLEKIFMYQDNLFKDISILFLESAFYSLVLNKKEPSKLDYQCFGSSFLTIFKEQIQGYRVSSAPLGPFILSKKGKTQENLVYLVSIENNAFVKGKTPKELGTNTFLKIYFVSEGKTDSCKSVLVPIYSVNLAQAKESKSVTEIFNNMALELNFAEKNLYKDKFILGGILIVSYEDKPFFKLKDKYALFSLSTKPNEWFDNLKDFRENLFLYLESIL